MSHLEIFIRKFFFNFMPRHMERRFLLIAIIVFWAYYPSPAQNKGGVSIHSDPRLAMLLGKSAAPAENAKAARGKKNSTKAKDKAVAQPIAGNAGSQLPKTSVVASAAPVREKTTPKIKDDAPPRNLKVKPVSEDESEAHAAVSGTSGGGKYTGKGFRVQIYNGSSRYEALRRKSEFMHNYPGIRTYLFYASPCYKLKAGDFRRREDAVGLYHEANGTYSPCMIVPDMIDIRGK